ncbi:hypothetical protein Tco_0505725 [Tanacetum coccineum]
MYNLDVVNDIATNLNTANNGQLVGKLEEWAHPYYRLFTWKEVYSHKVHPINDSNNWVKYPCPTTLLPPNYHLSIGRPKKKRTKSLYEKDEMVKNGKLGKKGRNVTCQSCGHLGNNKLTCKGQGKPSNKGGVFGNQGHSSGNQAGVSRVNMVGSQAFDNQAKWLGYDVGFKIYQLCKCLDFSA